MVKSAGTRMVDSKTVLSGRAYVLLFVLTAAIGIGLSIGYVYVIPKLTAFGVEDRAFYILLLAWGLCCAGFLFGIMRGFAHIKHKHLGTTVEFGGAAALFVAVVIGGFALAPNKQAFDLTVRAHSKGQPKVQKGQVTIECENFRRSENFDDHSGEANFKGLPQQCWGNDKTRFLPEVNGFCQEWQAVKISSSAVDLGLTPCEPHLSGVVFPLPGNIKDVTIIIDDGKEQSGIDVDGKFDIPVSATAGSVHLQVFVGSMNKYDSYQTVPGNVRVDLR